ncbi:MAG: hypothetical protein V4489_09920 [Chlamydiota bacterium]
MKDTFIDEIDHLILMHKDVHFGGNFSAMLNYYEKDAIGAQEEFFPDRIQDLALMEANSPTPLSDLILDEVDKKEVQRAKEAYQSLQKLSAADSFAAQKLALLILSEEEEPLQEIEELCSFGKEAIPPLLFLLKQEDFYNPLFPGYGLSPSHAANCLGKLKAKEAIIPLFESLSLMEFFGEEAAFKALSQIGDPARDFLLTTVKKAPLTKENENAAIALTFFPRDSLIISTCLDLLELPSVQARATLFTYLLFSCEGIEEESGIERVKDLLRSPLSIELREEVSFILDSSKKI